MNSAETIIQLENCDIFHSKNLTLSNVFLEVKKGEMVYLIGRTGTGKSSLLKVLYAELPLSHGAGTIAGFNLHKLPKKKIPYLRRKLGMVFQDFQLFNDRNAAANLEFVLRATGWKNKKKEIEQRIQLVLDKVDLGTKGFKMPYELSGGEQQRLVIARALLNDPEIILADEPTGNLDPETNEEILKLLKEISNSGRTVVMATHNYPLIEKFPARIVKFENGKVSELA
ncbi:MAG: ATP-binding cassette domain-containing protein [Bacteroidia bacterium]|nr:ATP-binding cassette domain-containing protein [Bacteroidia bacterium]